MIEPSDVDLGLWINVLHMQACMPACGVVMLCCVHLPKHSH
jgi:hypothetical protein